MSQMKPVRTVIVGTNNRKKGQELAALLQGVGLEIFTLADVPVPDGPQPLCVEESGTTFAENARLKAAVQARHLRRWVLADDSGLTVDALGGAPGVYSSRYAGPEADDAANRRRLLAELAGVPLEARGAGFVCHLALADPTGQVRAETEGRCRGRIIFEERGEHGFGYDPLFEVLEYHRTFGQLGETAKNRLSHRARAVARIVPELMRLVDTGEWEG